MIRSLLFLSASFLLASASLAQWVGGGSSGTTIHHQACAFHEVDTGLFVYGANDPGQGAGGIIITWSGLVGSGGNIWSTSPGNLEDIDVRMGSNGRPIYLAAGHKQYNQSIAVYQYLAGGSAFDFESVITGSGRYYRAVRMRSDIVAFAAGGDALGNGIIDMSTDTGFTWTNIAVLPGQPVSRLHFVDDQLGFAACGGYRRLFNNGVQLADSGAIYRTTDGGLTWLQVHADPDNGFSDVAFNSSLQGVASRNDGAILRTTDGGNTWTPATVNHPGPYIMTSVTFRPDGNGFASCYRADGTAGFILFSDDGGATWDFNFSTAGLNHSRRIYDMYFYDNAHGYACTHIRPLRSNGLITEVSEGQGTGFALYPNPASDEVTLSLEASGTSDIAVLDAVGRVVWSARSSDSTLSIPLNGLAPGSYVVRVLRDGEFRTRTLVRM
jgi:photosystem II stability/assembly factor-like uncharacterized protein